MNEIIAAFAGDRRLALVGVSRKKNKFGNAIFKTLRQRGYEVYPVHRSLTEIEGQKCYASLAELPDGVESLVVSTRAAEAAALVPEAKARGIKRIWFQQGENFAEAIAAAEAADLDHVTRKCILMYAGPVTGIHAVHRFFVKALGRL